MPKVAFYTLGCRLNFAETSGLAKRFQDEGYCIVPFEERADVYVVNTCTVTASAEKKCRQIIHQAHRNNPDARIAVVGCFSQLRPEEVGRLEGVDFVLGTHNKHLLFDYIRKGRQVDDAGPIGPGLGKTGAASVREFVSSYSSIGRTRSFFKIQDGCDNFCSYCAIPYARGRSRSADIARTMQTAAEIAASGVKEIVLTGVNIGDFGKNHGETFHQLLQAMDGLQGISRIRIGSVEPDLLTDEIISLIAGSRRLMPHFHIPLQAGENDVLKQMKRHYRRELYAQRVAKIRQEIPRAFIAGDVIVGFPTETDAQFEDGAEFIKSLDLSALHVFSYSTRAEAVASRLPAVYGPGTKVCRSRHLHFLSDQKKESFYRRFDMTRAEVLWESDQEDGMMFGYTDNYLRVQTRYDARKVNTTQEVMLCRLEKDAHKDWIFNCTETENELNRMERS